MLASHPHSYIRPQSGGVQMNYQCNDHDSIIMLIKIRDVLKITGVQKAIIELQGMNSESYPYHISTKNF